MTHILKKIEKPDSYLIEQFSNQATATVHEVMGKRGAIDSSIKPLFPGMRLCGPALTVKGHAGDNLMLLKALDMAQPGDVIVGDLGQLTEAGPWGEVTTVQAKVRKVEGLVTNGSVRDSMAIKDLEFPVFCKSVCIKGTAKESLGYINHPISIGETIVNPGDIILGDQDGVVVIPLSEAREILKMAKRREAKEAEYMKRIQEGESYFHFMGFDKVLKQKGCTEEDERVESGGGYHEK